MMNKILLVNDTSTNTNTGCQVTMYMVNKCLSQYFPGKIIDRIYLNQLDQFFAKTKIEVSNFFDRIDSSDIVIINGEGSIIENRNGVLTSTAKNIFTIIDRAHSKNIECHLINCTIHIMKPHNMSVAKKALDKCASVCVREPYSYYYTKKFFSRINLFPDLVCGLWDYKKAPKISNSILIGGGSATLLGPNVADNIKLIAKNIISGAHKQNVNVKLMGWKSDEYLKECVKYGAVYCNPTFQEYFDMCKESILNFTGRHHGIVMSFAAGCPFMTGNANCFKTHGDLHLYRGLGKVHNFAKVNLKDISTDIECAINNYDNNRHDIEGRRDIFMPFVFGCFDNIFKDTPDLIESGTYILPSDFRYIK